MIKRQTDHTFIYPSPLLLGSTENGYDIVEVDTEQNINETIPYGDPQRIHPIPNAELDANSNMEQNPGY